MLHRFCKPAAVVVGVLVLGSGTAAAATGGTFTLGRSNTASTQTLLSNTGSGPVLALSTKTGQVPLAVSAAAGKATNLNADRVDGLDGAGLALTSGGVGTISGTTSWADIDGDGTVDEVLDSFASCPAGSKVTGGGFESYTELAPSVNTAEGNGWRVIAVALSSAETTYDTTDLVAFAQCYNPRGAVPGAITGNALRAQSADVRAKLLEQLRR